MEHEERDDTALSGQLNQEAVEAQAPEEAEPSKRRRRRVLLALLLALILIGAGAYFLYDWGIAEDDGVIPLRPVTWTLEPYFLFSIDELDDPISVGATADQIFVAEIGEIPSVLIFDADGELTGFFDVPPARNETWTPGSLTVGPNETVYVIDTMNKDVSIHSTDGDFLDFFYPNGDPGYIWNPISLSFDAVGNVYAVDQTENRHQIMVFDPEGNLLLDFGYFGKANNMFKFPTDVIVDDNGEIYVCDSQNVEIKVFSPEGYYQRNVVGDFSLPKAIAFDYPGRLHVLDSLNHNAGVFNLAGPVLEMGYGGLGVGNGEFYYPTDLSLHESGRIYIADYKSDRVQVLSF
jgi:DNA-binding beta-propeller fold protein YncE